MRMGKLTLLALLFSSYSQTGHTACCNHPAFQFTVGWTSRYRKGRLLTSKEMLGPSLAPSSLTSHCAASCSCPEVGGLAKGSPPDYLARSSTTHLGVRTLERLGCRAGNPKVSPTAFWNARSAAATREAGGASCRLHSSCARGCCAGSIIIFPVPSTDLVAPATRPPITKRAVGASGSRMAG
jgi:hypothetical protein